MSFCKDCSQRMPNFVKTCIHCHEQVERPDGTVVSRLLACPDFVEIRRKYTY